MNKKNAPKRLFDENAVNGMTLLQILSKIDKIESTVDKLTEDKKKVSSDEKINSVLKKMDIIKHDINIFSKNQRLLESRMRSLSKSIELRLSKLEENCSSICDLLVGDDDDEEEDSSSGNKDIVISCDSKMGGNPLEMLMKLFGKQVDKQPESQFDDKSSEVDYNEDIYHYKEEIPQDTLFSEINEDIDTLDKFIEVAKRVQDIEEPEDNKEPEEDEIDRSGLYFYKGKYYGLNIEKIPKLIKPMEKLNRMIGLADVKKSIINFVLYFLQNNQNDAMLHTVIEGPPGVGKTQLGKILAEIYAALGVIPSEKFKLVKRTDLIGECLGHTARKTQDVIDEANGGVLFIDEAYSLGSTERDIYSKECIDTLNQNLSENKKKLIVIIAGYPNELDKHFFAINPGLKRRFPFKFSIEGYSNEEMYKIFVYKLKANKLKLDKSATQDKLVAFFAKNKENFANSGGDIENFITVCKFENNKRMFGKHPAKRGVLTMEDIKTSHSIFAQNKERSGDKIPFGMYI